MIDQSPSYQTEFYKPNGRELYDFLSKTLQQFSYCMTCAQKILSLHLRDETYQQQKVIAELQQKLKNRQILSDYEQLHKFSSSTTSSVYKRFIARMLEIILPIKHKAISNPKNALVLIRLIKQIQNFLSQFQEDLKLQSLLENLFNGLGNYIHNVKNINRCEFLPINTKKSLQKQRPFHSNSVNQKQCVSALLPQQVESPNKFRRQFFRQFSVVNGLNVRFNTVSCLDLDYNHFRSTFFQIKNRQDYYSEYMERNKTIQSSILTYSKQFRGFITKKTKKRNQKRLSFRTSVASHHSKKSNRSVNKAKKIITTDIQLDKKLAMKINNWAGQNNRPLLKPNKIMRQQEHSVQGQDTDYSPLKKTYYRMNNILLTASRLKIGSINSQQNGVGLKNNLDLCFKRSKRMGVQQIKPQNNSFL